MANASTNVKFFMGSLNRYNALQVKDPMAIYFITDDVTNNSYMYVGDKLYASDSVASSIKDGLMAHSDKIALDTLIENAEAGYLSPADGSVKIEDKKINVSISASADNALQSLDDGLFIRNTLSDEVNDKIQNLTEEGQLSTDFICNGVNSLILDGGSAVL